MSTDTDSLRDLYVSVTGEEAVTESQAEEPSRDPVGDDEAAIEAQVSEVATADGLEDAVAGAELSEG